MLISPPFLVGTDDAGILQAGLNPVPTRDSTTQAPEGNFPVSQNLMWHTGVHLEAPIKEEGGYASVRAIADGEIIFVNRPRSKVDDVNHPQAYNPFGDNASWIDNGMIIIEHETEIGADGSTPTKFKYYSSYLHLSRVQFGIAKDKQVYRKDVIGETGEIFGHAGEMEMSIACNADELKKLIGRQPAWQDPKREPATDGRTDSVFGNLYIYLRADTPVSAAAPTSHLRAASSNTLGTAQWVEINYALGQGTLTTYAVDGTKGNTTSEADFEYNLYKEANTRHDGVIAGDPTTVSSPSGWYELLRFGRNLGRSTTDKDPLPANAAHWRKIKTIDGKDVWADLNAAGSRKFSEADFLPVMGWNCYDDDSQPQDQRCDSAKFKELIADPADPDSKNDKAKLAARLGLPEVFPKLARTICKFPNEWDKDTIVTRYQCLKEEAEAKAGGTVEGWQAFEDHLKIMAFDTLPDAFKQADWHFHSAEFIRTMRKCGWLSKEELKAIYPTTSGLLREKYRKQLNIAMHKYGITTALRMGHFYGQGAVESLSLNLMQEGGNNSRLSKASELALGHWYGTNQPAEADSWFADAVSGVKRSYQWFNGNLDGVDPQKFRGRGFKQLTGRSLYADYYIYRGWLKKTDFDARWWDDPQYKAKNREKMTKKPAQIDTPQIVATDEYNCIDSGAFYITFIRPDVISVIDGDTNYPVGDKANDAEKKIVEKVTRAINGGINGLPERIENTHRIKKVLM